MPDQQSIYPELKIEIRGDDTIAVSTLERTVLGGKIDPDELLLETLKAFRDWLNQGKLRIREEGDLMLLGKLLYRLLFNQSGPGIKGLVNEKLKGARRSKKRICVQLAFLPGQGDLASLPWEFLYDPESSSFLATESDLILTRYVSGESNRQSLSSNAPPLHLLIVVSKPKGLGTVMHVQEVDAIKQFSEQHAGQIVLHETLTNKNYLELRKYLEDLSNPVQLVHFIGHGRYNKAKRQGELALVSMDGEGIDWVEQNRFTRLFTDAGRIPNLLFLQLCEGAAVEGAELISSFEGLAPALVAADIQGVVAMQFPIKMDHATKITTTFYDELTRGKSFGEAVQSARRLVSTYDALAGGTPVLYMYGFDGAIVSTPAPSPMSGAARLGPGTLGGVVQGATALPASGVPSTPRGERPETGSTMPPRGGEPTGLEDVLAAGNRRIKELEATLEEDERLNVNKYLYITVRPALRECKAMSDILDKLGTFLKQAPDKTPLADVLDEMFKKAEKLA